jgi:hypothetical protein
VPSSAEAIVFLDPAELLACLARDLLLGTVAGNWWWQAWLRASGRSTEDLVLDAWVREACHVPAAMAALHDRSLAVTFAEALSPRQARTLFVALTEAYELPALAAPTPLADVPIVSMRGDPGPAARRAGEPVAANRRDAAATPIVDRFRPPWEPFVPPSYVPPALGLEQRTFLGVALALARAPLAVRARAFQRAFHTWRRAEQFRPPAVAPGASPVREPGDSAAPTARPAEEAGTRSEVVEREGDARPAFETAATPVAPTAPMSQTRPIEPLEGASDAEAFSVARPREDGDQASESPSQGEGRRPPVDGPRPTGRLRERPGSPATVQGSGAPVTAAMPSARVPTTTATSPDVRVAAPAQPIEFVRTGLAGLFFLINALERLELFDRLDDHFGVTSSLGGWAWLEIIARSLLGRRRTDVLSDPIWDVLASLDGRDPGAPVSGTFRGPRSYRRPESWPAPEGTDTTRARRRCGRPLGVKPVGDLRRFLDTLVPYLRWRLLKGLALEAPSARDEEALLVSRLLYRRGRVSCTRTHVDLHMSMGQVDIAIRLAGLDANPGWVPALGRVVTFYYD